jgi:hypothetical protein
MRKFFLFAVLGLALTGMGTAQGTYKPRIIDVHRATIITFLYPISQKELDSGEGDAEAFNDFGYYFYLVEKRLRGAGIDLLSVNAREFQVRDGKTIRTFKTGKIGIGYYPGQTHIKLPVISAGRDGSMQP